MEQCSYSMTKLLVFSFTLLWLQFFCCFAFGSACVTPLINSERTFLFLAHAFLFLAHVQISSIHKPVKFHDFAVPTDLRDFLFINRHFVRVAFCVLSCRLTQLKFLSDETSNTQVSREVRKLFGFSSFHLHRIQPGEVNNRISFFTRWMGGWLRRGVMG